MRSMFLTSLISGPAFASAVTLAAAIAPPVLAQDTGTVVVSKTDCLWLVRHVPSGDVTYQPGVDVRGRPVPPADLPGSTRWKVPDSITIDIGIDLAEKYGLGAGGKYTGEAVIARVTVDAETGDISIDGQPLRDAERNAIAAACRDAYKD